MLRRSDTSDVCSSNLILLACTEDEVVIRDLPGATHQHVLGCSVDARHLARHHVDPGAQGKLGMVLVTVAVAEWTVE